MQNFILNIWNAYTLIDVVLIMFFAMLSLFYFLRLKQAKKKLKDYQFFSTVSAQTMQDYEDQIKLQECQIADVKKYFEDAVTEITELRSKNKVLESKCSLLDSCNDENLKSLNYWKERALHQKHSKPVKQVESEYWECIYNQYAPEFINGNRYEVDKSKNSFLNTLFLIGESKCTCLVESKYFKPVVK